MSPKTPTKIFLACLFFAALAGAPFAHAVQLININTDDKAALTTLNGIGDVKAQAIIDYRIANGPFAKIEDIVDVKGIGPATFNNIKDYITVADSIAQTQPAISSTPVQPSSQVQTKPKAVAVKKSPVASPAPKPTIGKVLGESTSSASVQSGGDSSALQMSLAALAGLLIVGGASAYYLRPRYSRGETPLSAEEFDIE